MKSNIVNVFSVLVNIDLKIQCPLSLPAASLPIIAHCESTPEEYKVHTRRLSYPCIIGIIIIIIYLFIYVFICLFFYLQLVYL